MSATTSTTTTASAKTQTGQKNQGSQGPRVSNGAAGGARKAANGNNKTEGARKSPQTGANGQQAKGKASPKPKATANMSDYLRGREATVDIANLVAQIRADLGGYYSEELVFNTLSANNNNPDATRAALTQSKATSWASKVSPSAAIATPSAPAATSSGAVPAPAHIARQQQGPRPRKVKTEQEKKPAAPEPEAEPQVDPEQMEKSLESALQATQTQAQELLGLQTSVSTVRAAQTELTSEKDHLLQKIAQHEAEIAKDRARIQAIDTTLSQHKQTLADLQKTISQKTSK